MKTIMLIEFGDTDLFRIQESDTPVIKDDEVLIKVSQIGVNYGDIAIRKGQFHQLPVLPGIIGMEAGGEIVAIGKNVKTLAIGLRVVARSEQTYAEYVAVKDSEVYVIPENVDFGVALALLTQGITAKNLFESVKYKSALIHAAAGGVGSIALQLAKLSGAFVIGLASPQKHSFLKELGADAVIGYNAEEIRSQVMKLTNNEGVDLVLEATGGEIGSLSIDLIGYGGRIVCYGSSSGLPTTIYAQQLIPKKVSLTGSTLDHLSAERKHLLFQELIETYLDGKLSIKIDQYAFEKVADAHQAMEARQTVGKIVLVV
jgi:NADPH2:quinone reductase